MAEILVGEGHNGGAITAKAGDMLVVRLPENPTTGFRWSIVRADAALLRQQSDTFTPPSGGAIGAGGTRVFRYLVAGTGHGSLVLQLARSWEANAPRQQFAITVSVQ